MQELAGRLVPQTTTNARAHQRAHDRLLAAVERIEELVERCDRIAHLEPLPQSLAELVLRELDAFVHELDRQVRESAPSAARELGQAVKAALVPMLQRADNGWRWCAKPRGYAGDYLTIARIYDDRASGDGPVGALLDRCCLDVPAAIAVRNRRHLLAEQIRATVAAARGHAARVTSLAAGPARELFDVYARLDQPGALVSTLVDFDVEALQACSVESARHEVDHLVALVDANLIHVAVGRRALELAPQDLVYSIGLVDYFADDLAVKLLDAIHAMLRPGGRVVLGNFHPRNPTRAFMDHVLDWPLVHRDEAAMHALFRASAFRTGCTRIFYEPLGINLFAECVRT